jgi:hypothetical protein
VRIDDADCAGKPFRCWMQLLVRGEPEPRADGCGALRAQMWVLGIYCSLIGAVLLDSQILKNNQDVVGCFD